MVCESFTLLQVSIDLGTVGPSEVLVIYLPSPYLPTLWAAGPVVDASVLVPLGDP